MKRIMDIDVTLEEELPTLAEFKEQMTKAKAEKKLSVYVLQNYGMLKAEYLQTGIKATGSSIVKYTDSPYKPVVLDSKDENVRYMACGMKNYDNLEPGFHFINK